jgi:glycosyltransferase involved in cell wall biosynthesis
MISGAKVSPEELAAMYNAVDFTLNISDAEGFGLGTLESLSCGSPIIVNMTGGLKEQVTDGKNWFGFGIEPTSKAVIGSLDVPYIYEDRISQKDFNNTLKSAMSLSKKAYKKMSLQGVEHVRNNYNFEKYEQGWVDIMDEVVASYGSWETRQGYNRWHIREVA